MMACSHRVVAALLLASWCGPAQGQVREPVQVDDLANFQVQLDERLFYVLSALELARGAAMPDAAPARDSARVLLQQDLRGCDPNIVQPLADFLRDRSAAQVHSQLLSLSLLLEPPPSLELSVSSKELPDALRPLAALLPVIAEFYTACGSLASWEKYRPLYAADARRYLPLVRELMLETLRYFHMDPRISLDRKIFLIPDLLNPFGTAHARNIQEDYYLILGPFKDTAPHREAIRHEYMHFLLDPLILKYGSRILDKEALFSLVREQPEARELYESDFFLVATESLLRVAETRITRAADEAQGAERLAQLYRRGLVLSFYFDQALARFETLQEMTLPEHLPELIDGIDVKSERERAREIARQAEAEAAVRRWLLEANEALERGDFAAARPLLGRVLQRRPDQPAALFGLAQIQAAGGESRLALPTFLRAAQAPDSPSWIRAWSLVRAARIHLFLGDRDSAAQCLREATRVSGETRGAADAARQELDRMAAPPGPAAPPRP